MSDEANLRFIADCRVYMESCFAQSMSNMKLKPCATLKFTELIEFVTLKKKFRYCENSEQIQNGKP